MPVIATAEVDVKFNDSGFNQKLQSQINQVQSSINRSITSINQVTKKVRNSLLGIGFASVYKFLKSNNAEASVFKTKIDRLSSATASLGGKILKLRIFGNSISGWTDVLARKISNISQNELQRMFNILKSITLLLAGLNLGRFAFNVTSQVNTITKSIQKLSALNVASNVGGGLLGGLFGGGVGAKLATMEAKIFVNPPVKPDISKLTAQLAGGGTVGLTAIFSKTLKGIASKLRAINRSSSFGNIFALLGKAMTGLKGVFIGLLAGLKGISIASFAGILKGIATTIFSMKFLMSTIWAAFAVVVISLRKVVSYSSELKYLGGKIKDAIKGLIDNLSMFLGAMVEAADEKIITPVGKGLATTIKALKYVFTGQFDKIRDAAAEVELEGILSEIKKKTKLLNEEMAKKYFKNLQILQKSIESLEFDAATFRPKTKKEEIGNIQSKFNAWSDKLDEAQKLLLETQRRIKIEQKQNPEFIVEGSTLGNAERELKSTIIDLMGKQRDVFDTIAAMYDDEFNFRQKQKDLFARYHELTGKMIQPRQTKGSIVSAEQLREQFQTDVFDYEQRMIELAEQQAEREKEAQEILRQMSENDTERFEIERRKYSMDESFQKYLRAIIGIQDGVVY